MKLDCQHEYISEYREIGGGGLHSGSGYFVLICTKCKHTKQPTFKKVIDGLIFSAFILIPIYVYLHTRDIIPF